MYSLCISLDICYVYQEFITIFCSRVHLNTAALLPADCQLQMMDPRGGTRYIKEVGMLVENFEIDP